MSDEYKVRYQRLGSNAPQVTEWMTKEEARSRFNRFKISLKVIWAELVYSSLDDDADDEEVVIDDFEYNVVDLFGHLVLVP